MCPAGSAAPQRCLVLCDLRVARAGAWKPHPPVSLPAGLWLRCARGGADGEVVGSVGVRALCPAAPAGWQWAALRDRARGSIPGPWGFLISQRSCPDSFSSSKTFVNNSLCQTLTSLGETSRVASESF